MRESDVADTVCKALQSHLCLYNVHDESFCRIVEFSTRIEACSVLGQLLLLPLLAEIFQMLDYLIP
jgi:hypothetical protein